MTTILEARIEEWRTNLLDLSKRNRLIHLNLGRYGAVKLIHPSPQTLWSNLVGSGERFSFPEKQYLTGKVGGGNLQNGNRELAVVDDEENHENSGPEAPSLEDCLSSPRLRSDHLLTELTDKHLKSRLSRMQLNATTSLAEQGVPTLYVAFGLLKWFESDDSQDEIISPLLLYPVELERDNINSPWTLKVSDDEVVSNHSLAQLMLNNFSIKLPEYKLSDQADGEGESSQYFNVSNYFVSLEKIIKNNVNWKVLDDCVLGIFSFQKIAMWEDLNKNKGQITKHDLCRAVAGDPLVRVDVPHDLPRAGELDKKAHPTTTYHILDSDSSQHEAIEAAKRGTSLVLDGPPGTGKSQTIANIIAEFIALNKTVLFVSEKSAALEVVKKRLDKRKLGDFCLECHSHKSNKKMILDELGRCLYLDRETFKDNTQDLNQLFEKREYLNAYVEAVHEIKYPLGLSAFQVHGMLAVIANGPTTRCPIPNVATMTQDGLRRTIELLATLPDYQPVIQDYYDHPWRGLKYQKQSFNLKADTEHHLATLDAALGPIQEGVSSLCSLGLSPDDPSIPTWVSLLESLKEITSYPVVPKDWFQSNPRRSALGFIDLNKHTHSFRNWKDKLPEFSTKSILDFDCKKLESLKVLHKKGGFPFASNDALSLKVYISLLKAVKKPLKELANQVKLVTQCLKSVLEVMAVEARPFWSRLSEWPRTIDKVQELLGLVGKVSPIRRSWLDPQRRMEIQRVIDRCKEESAKNSECRFKLIDRFFPLAFESKSFEIVKNSLSFLPFWKRFFPGWRKTRQQATAFYSAPTPKDKDLLKDMLELKEYHQRLLYLKQMENEYASELLLNEDGKIDWDKTSQSLKFCEKLDPLFLILPEIKELMFNFQGVDQSNLVRALHKLSNATKVFSDAFKAVSNLIPLDEIPHPDRKPKWTLDELLHWLEKQQSQLEACLPCLEEVSTLLLPSQELSLHDLPSRLLALEGLLTENRRIDEISSRLLNLPNPDEVRALDWSQSQNNAEWTLSFLDRYKDSPPESLVRVITDPEIHQQASNAICQNIGYCNSDFLDAWKFICNIFDFNNKNVKCVQLGSISLSQFRQWVRARRQDLNRIHEWVGFVEIAEQVRQAGLSVVLKEVFDGRLPVHDAQNAFLARFYQVWLDWVYESSPILRRFSTDDHERNIDQFKSLDRESIKKTNLRIRQIRLNDSSRPTASMFDAPSSSELGILLKEVNKKNRHLPLRKLFSRIPTVLQRLKPCLMMSPLAVSTYLDNSEIQFDVVIFDEGSQVRPYDAISSIYRGRQLIVAGDQKQLPPTSFFDRLTPEVDIASEDGEEMESIADFESILDVCCTLGFPRCRLRWHYRSRREPLIAFSNRHYYGNDLVTFPSVFDTGNSPAVRFEYLKSGHWKSGTSGGVNRIEARKTAELVMNHFRTNPQSSLGVIAFSQRQQMAIIDELENFRKNDLSLESFFGTDRDEPFFVKNLENVQGDERDVIFLSIGYGPDENGRLAMRFGPLNRQGGERRLNVAITRARSNMTVISSIRASDIDLSRTPAVGPKLLRAYLDFAERGISALGAEITEVHQADFDSPFEKEVMNALIKEGLQVKKQVGCSGYKIDLALVDPSEPGRFILGVECDGATYHSAATARDRDRLRQEVLESLGWKIVRIWSTDWIKNPKGQIQRILEIYQKRLNEPIEQEGITPKEGVKDSTEDSPVTIEKANPRIFTIPTQKYQSINDVPESIIIDFIITILDSFGETDQNELIQSVARKLGFNRTGAKIRERIESCLESLKAVRKVIQTENQSLKINGPQGLKLA